MSHCPEVSVVIVCLNGADVIENCLKAVLANDHPSFETIVVNNGSTDATADIVSRQFPEVRLINLPKNRGFAGGNNEGIKASRGEFVVLLNDDTIGSRSLLAEIVRPMLEDPAIGVVGCKILYPDGKTIQHAGGAIGPNGLTRHIGYEEIDRGQFGQLRDVDYVSGCCMAARREVFRKIGLLDSRYFPIYYEEVEFCARARKAGYRVVFAPGAVLRHLESKTQIRYSARYNYRYNKGRWRFILKNFSAREIARAIRHELKWVWADAGFDTLGYVTALGRAYLATLIRLPMILYDRKHRFLPLGDEKGLDQGALERTERR